VCARRIDADYRKGLHGDVSAGGTRVREVASARRGDVNISENMQNPVKIKWTRLTGAIAYDVAPVKASR
jgi:hypothetical protein